MKIKSLFRIGALMSTFALLASPAMAKRAVQTPIDVLQPDGSILKIRILGDENCHVRVTEDGFPVVSTPDRGYVYASVSDEGMLLPTGVMAHSAGERNNAEISVLSRIPANSSELFLERKAGMLDSGSISLSGKGIMRGPGLHATTFPYHGEQKGLVILVEYTDVKFDSKNSSSYKYSKYSNSATPVNDYWHDLLNLPGFNGFGGTGSCRDWFMDNSTDANGTVQFTPQFDVLGPVTLAHPMRYYGANDAYGDDEKMYEMVIEACKALDSQVDFNDYDRDGDGFVDNVYIFYAGFGEADCDDENTVWPHSWDLTKAGKAFKLDGVTISHYACSNEVDYSYKRPDGIGTFVHEFSHVMGLPDLYSTVYNSAYTPNDFSVMDYGPYNNQGRTPPNYSAYERYAFDWMQPKEYGESGSYELPNMADTNEAYIVKTEKINEYYLVENRQLTGWDKYLPGHGMLIWHIDYKASIFDLNKVNNTPSHQYVDLIEANGRKNSLYKSGHPFPGTDNVTTYNFKSWNNKSTGISFENIEESNGIIRKNVINANMGTISVIDSENAEAEYYNLQGMKVYNPQKGEILIKITPQGSEKIIF